MKCALLIPPWTPTDIFPAKTAGSQVNYWQPLGTLYVAAGLRLAGHEVKLFDGAFLARDEMLAEVESFAPRFAGIYSTAFSWVGAKRLAAAIKGLDERIFTCIGGPYPIAAREKCLADDVEHVVDAVVTGEGEITVPEMVRALELGAGLTGVAGVVFRDGDGVVANDARPLVDNLDSLPFPAREVLGDAGLYLPPPATYRRQPVAVMLTSRGCNRRCIYCFQLDKDRDSGIRYRGVENVLAEIELCLEQGYREIKFIDDTFAADYGRALRIAREIKARRLDFTWFVSACVNQVDKELLQAFKDAGCWAILLGAESGVQKNLNTIKKGITLDQTRQAVAAAKAVGLKVITPFIFGIPGESFEDGLKTIEFACELDADVANFHAITPFPGTELYDNAAKYGAVSDELTDYTYQGAAFVPYTMSRDEIVELRATAFRTFYSRPKFLLRRALATRNIHDLKAACAGAKSLFWLWADSHALDKRASAGKPATGGKRASTKKGWC
ncbi:MAG: radical SAM protein [Actinobacteria bacterium]|nr:radical SAM protein [Actinomycetota bacterium]